MPNQGHFPTVEHAFHAAKAKLASNKPSMAKEFAVGGAIPTDPLVAKRAGGRRGYEQRWATLDMLVWNSCRDATTMVVLQVRARTPSAK